ncbi:MAG: hypothetical protein DRG20_07245 [Deltaproteobacteria bacterium]|nr:MAG: hypothetical protein DRG20_07245 [Deltaproteobacteria bacterium]
MLSIGIITYNRKDLLRKCLLSVFEKIGKIASEIIIVDNNSKDGTQKMIEKEFKTKVVLITNKINKGVAGGRNQILKRYKGKYLLLIDDDTEIMSTNILKMIDYMKKNKKVGILGCKILTPENQVYSSARKFPRPANILARKLSALSIFKNTSLLKPYKQILPETYFPKRVDFVIGACQLIKRETQEKIGLLDERMKFGFEDADYCARAIKAGFEVVYYPFFAIKHYKGIVSDRTFSKFLLYYVRSYLLFYLKHKDLLK